MDARILTTEGLQALLDTLHSRGYRVLGPVVRDGAIGFGPVRAIAELPAGWGDEQDAGHYRLRRRDDALLFGYAASVQSAKPLFFPAQEVLWRARRDPADEDGMRPVAVAPAEDGPVAVLGVRSCDLAAIGIQDVVLSGRQYGDAAYALRRADTFVVAVTCSHPGGTCFCVSTSTGPRPGAGPGTAAAYDLAMTEVLDEQGHRFVVEVAGERGSDVLDDVARTIEVSAARPEDLAAADGVAARAAERMGRHLDTDGLKELLYASAESPVWDDVATRCLACTNCTQVCPTCFCTDVRDVTDLTGGLVERERVWDSCFNAEYSYIHGGSVRASTRARYRQWLTHKLGSWEDQFGMSGCVGCGRCITWCPAAIDLTAEVAALREEG